MYVSEAYVYCFKALHRGFIIIIIIMYVLKAHCSLTKEQCAFLKFSLPIWLTSGIISFALYSA